MRRFARHLFTLCSAVSALLLVLVLAVWVRSWFRVDGLIYQPRLDNPLHLLQVGWGRGTMGAGMYAAEPTATSRWFWYSSAPGPVGTAPPDPDAVEFLGFRLVRRIEYVLHPLPASRPASSLPKTPVREISVTLPCWQAALLSACLPTTWLLRRRRRTIARLRSERGQCGRCGYDLRATPGRCPECGTSETVPRVSSACSPG